MTRRKAAIHHRAAGEILTDLDMQQMYALYQLAKAMDCDVVSAAFDTPTGSNFARFVAEYEEEKLGVVFYTDGDDVQTVGPREPFPLPLSSALDKITADPDGEEKRLLDKIFNDEN